MVKIGKKKIIILVVVVLVLVGGGFFCWQNREIKGSPEDYVIKETAAGIIVENKKAGLVLKVPEGWEVKKVEIEEGAVDFSSPDLETEQKEGKIVLPFKKGCKIQASIRYEKLSFADIEIESRYSFVLMGMKSVNFEETTVNMYPALKSTFDKQEGGVGVGISISIPTSNKVYGFSVVWGPNEKERCIQEFDRFLETIQIK